MGEMGERERLEQEHADKMRLKNRDESAVKVQFQIDAYKKVFAEQRQAGRQKGSARRSFGRLRLRRWSMMSASRSCGKL